MQILSLIEEKLKRTLNNNEQKSKILLDKNMLKQTQLLLCVFLWNLCQQNEKKLNLLHK